MKSQIHVGLRQLVADLPACHQHQFTDIVITSSPSILPSEWLISTMSQSQQQRYKGNTPHTVWICTLLPNHAQVIFLPASPTTHKASDMSDSHTSAQRYQALLQLLSVQTGRGPKSDKSEAQYGLPRLILSHWSDVEYLRIFLGNQLLGLILGVHTTEDGRAIPFPNALRTLIMVHNEIQG